MASHTSGIPHLQFSQMSAFGFVSHGIFTRVGGVSLPPFGSLNVSFSTGDKKEHVHTNRELIHHQMGGTTSVYAHQVHKDGILHVTDRSSNTQLKFQNCGEGDAMVTSMPGINLVLQVADCQPVLLVDPVKKVVAAVHSGWRGSILNIVGKTLTVMTEHHGCDPSDIRAGIGPSLGPCCAEFINYETEIPKHLWGYKSDENHFDFWAMTRDQMVVSGVLEENIETANICTKCHSEQFFSYRKANNTGRFAAVIGLTSEADNG